MAQVLRKHAIGKTALRVPSVPWSRALYPFPDNEVGTFISFRGRSFPLEVTPFLDPLNPNTLTAAGIGSGLLFNLNPQNLVPSYLTDFTGYQP